MLQLGSWFAMLGVHREWLGSWRMALDWAAGSVIIGGPLLSGLVAVSCSAWRRTALPDLVLGSTRRARGWFESALRLWVAGVASVVVTAIAVTVRALLLDMPIAPRQFLILVPCAFVLAAHALIGMVVGLNVSPRVAPALAALTSFALFLLATRHLAPPSFITGGVTGPMVGEQYELAALAALTGFGALTVLAVAPWAKWRGPRWRGRWMVSAVAGALALGLAQLVWPDIEGRLEFANVSYRCAGEGPRVCVAADVAGDVGETARRFDRLAAALRDGDVLLPDRWQQVLPGRSGPSSSGALDLSVEAEWGDRIDDGALVRSLATPADCPAYYDNTEPPMSYQARQLLARWIGFRNGRGDVTRASPWFSSSDSDTWIRRTYLQLKACDLDAIRTP